MRQFISGIRNIVGKRRASFVISLFAIWMSFFDDYDIFTRLSYDNKISKLKQEIAFYQREIEMSEQRTLELQSSNENLEKFARERYLMKKNNEVIFVISE